MEFKIDIKHTVRFLSDNSFNLGGSSINPKIPALQGVYILHHGSIQHAWGEPGRIFYIGASDREKLNVRARKHRDVLIKTLNSRGKRKMQGAPKMLQYGVSIDHDLSDTSFSCYPLPIGSPSYLPFLLEGFILDSYIKNFGKKPAVTGR
ncbi:hypothetical protein [Saccharospirillum sp.]|uniref:hypothetical protein n=1 Tax=Saccharospirillum sp. TaxID=2033801 RepID=UPI00349FF446